MSNRKRLRPSATITAMARAHALLPLADGEGVAPGDPVRVLLLADI